MEFSNLNIFMYISAINYRKNITITIHVAQCATEHNKITACTAVQYSVMDDSVFVWAHAIFGPTTP
jgi:hypothetical protein